MAEFWLQSLLVLDATLRVATPLILCAMAGIFSERAGIIDISLEGKMLLSAFAAASVAALYGAPFLALGAAILTSMLFSLLHGFASITHRGNQVISGLAINILASGLTITLGIALFAQGGQTPYLTAQARFSDITLPFAESARSVPIIGTIYAEVISGHNLLVWLALLAVAVTGFVLYPHEFRLAPPCRRRETRSRGYRRRQCRAHTLSSGANRRRVMRHCRGVFVGRAWGRIRPRDDRRQGLYRISGDDFRALAPASCLVRVFDVRLS